MDNMIAAYLIRVVAFVYIKNVKLLQCVKRNITDYLMVLKAFVKF